MSALLAAWLIFSVLCMVAVCSALLFVVYHSCRKLLGKKSWYLDWE